MSTILQDRRDPGQVTVVAEKTIRAVQRIRITGGPPVSCSHRYSPGLHLPSALVYHSKVHFLPAPLHSTGCGGTSRPSLVACFLSLWNGLMLFQHTTAPSVHVYSDASGFFGYGGVVLPSHWFKWPTTWSAMDIRVKEMVPIVIAAAPWGGSWHRTHLFSIRQSGSSSYPPEVVRKEPCHSSFSSLFLFLLCIFSVSVLCGTHFRHT